MESIGIEPILQFAGLSLANSPLTVRATLLQLTKVYSSNTIKNRIMSSNKIHNGKAINTWVNISGGENSAPTMKQKIVHSFLLFNNDSILTNFKYTDKKSNTGNWNAILIQKRQL